LVLISVISLLSLSALFYIKIEEEEKLIPWDFAFLILIFRSLDRDEWMVRLKKYSNLWEQKMWIAIG
jgi:hypothetical protein